MLNKRNLADGETAERELYSSWSPSIDMEKSFTEDSFQDFVCGDGFSIEVKFDNRATQTGNLGIEIGESTLREGGRVKLTGILKTAIRENATGKPIIEVRKFGLHNGGGKFAWTMYRPAALLEYALSAWHMSRCVTAKSGYETWGNQVLCIDQKQFIKSGLFPVQRTPSELLRWKDETLSSTISVIDESIGRDIWCGIMGDKAKGFTF